MNTPVFACLILLIAFAVAIPWALRLDRADAHLQHRPGSGCLECEES
jgi:hypothetical protein